MFFDIVDMATSYIQYLTLLLRLSPESLPSFYTSPISILRYSILDSNTNSTPGQLYSSHLSENLPFWFPLDIRFRFLFIVIVGPLALSTLGLLFVYGKSAYLWFVSLLVTLFMFLFGAILLANMKELASPALTMPSHSKLEILTGVGLPLFFLLLALGVLCMSRARLRRLHDDAKKLEYVVGEVLEERESQRATLRMIDRERIDAVAVAAVRVHLKHREDRITHLDFSDVFWQGAVVAALILGTLVCLGVLPVASLGPTQHSIVFKVVGGVSAAVSLLATVWWILSMFRSGRAFLQACSNVGSDKVLNLLLTAVSVLYINIVTNFISLVYCEPVTCAAGSRLPHSASLFPPLPGSGESGSTTANNITAAVLASSGSRCLACNVHQYAQRCSAAQQQQLCSTPVQQSRLVYDTRVPCASVDSFYRVSGALMLVFYLLFLPYLLFFMAQYGVRVLQDVYPLERRYEDVFTSEELYIQKVLVANNNAVFVFRAYKPQFRFYRITFLAQKIVLGTVGCVMQKGHHKNISWIGPLFFIVIPLLALCSAVYLRPFARPTETLFFPSVQAMVSVCSVICLVAQRNGVTAVPMAVWKLLLVALVAVPIIMLIIGSVLTLRDDRRWNTLLQTRLVKSVTAAYAALPANPHDGGSENSLQPWPLADVMVTDGVETAVAAEDETEASPTREDVGGSRYPLDGDDNGGAAERPTVAAFAPAARASRTVKRDSSSAPLGNLRATNANPSVALPRPSFLHGDSHGGGDGNGKRRTRSSPRRGGEGGVVEARRRCRLHSGEGEVTFFNCAGGTYAFTPSTWGRRRSSTSTEPTASHRRWPSWLKMQTWWDYWCTFGLIVAETAAAPFLLFQRHRGRHTHRNGGSRADDPAGLDVGSQGSGEGKVVSPRYRGRRLPPPGQDKQFDHTHHDLLELSNEDDTWTPIDSCVPPSPTGMGRGGKKEKVTRNSPRHLTDVDAALSESRGGCSPCRHSSLVDASVETLRRRHSVPTSAAESSGPGLFGSAGQRLLSATCPSVTPLGSPHVRTAQSPFGHDIRLSSHQRCQHTTGVGDGVLRGSTASTAPPPSVSAPSVSPLMPKGDVSQPMLLLPSPPAGTGMDSPAEECSPPERPPRRVTMQLAVSPKNEESRLCSRRSSDDSVETLAKRTKRKEAEEGGEAHRVLHEYAQEERTVFVPALYFTPPAHATRPWASVLLHIRRSDRRPQRKGSGGTCVSSSYGRSHRTVLTGSVTHGAPRRSVSASASASPHPKPSGAAEGEGVEEMRAAHVSCVEERQWRRRVPLIALLRRFLGLSPRSGGRDGNGMALNDTTPAAVLNFWDVCGRRQRCARAACSSELARPHAAREGPRQQRELARHAHWGTPTDAMLGVVDVPGSVPPWTLFCGAAAPTRSTMALLQRQYYRWLSTQPFDAQRGEERTDSLGWMTANADSCRGEGREGGVATAGETQRRAYTSGLHADLRASLGAFNRRSLLSSACAPHVFKEGLAFLAPEDPVRVAARECQARAIHLRQEGSHGLTPLPLASTLWDSTSDETLPCAAARGCRLSDGAATAAAAFPHHTAATEEGAQEEEEEVTGTLNWLAQWGPLLTELLYEAANDDEADVRGAQKGHRHAKREEEEEGSGGKGQGFIASGHDSLCGVDRPTRVSSCDAAARRPARSHRDGASDPSRRSPSRSVRRREKSEAEAPSSSPQGGNNREGCPCDGGDRPSSSAMSSPRTPLHAIGRKRSMLLSLIMGAPSQRGSVSPNSSDEANSNFAVGSTACGEGDSSGHDGAADRVPASPDALMMWAPTSFPTTSPSPNGRGRGREEEEEEVQGTVRGNGCTKRADTCTSAVLQQVRNVVDTADRPRCHSPPPPDPLIQQLRCLFLVRERLKKAFWEHQEQLTALQSYIDFEVDVAVRHVLMFLFVILGVVATVALTFALCGMLHTVDRNFINGVANGETTVWYELAGYPSWTDFTANCCCVASTNATPHAPYYALDVEDWVCANGVTKERVRRDGVGHDIKDGYAVRGLCGMNFEHNCTVVVGPGERSVTLEGCDVNVVTADAMQRW